MRSTVQLFNTALARLGGEQLDERIASQETDTLGALCSTLFAHVLDLALSAHPWTFALHRVALAVLADATENDEYPLAYALPSDCVRPVFAAPDELRIQIRVTSRKGHGHGRDIPKPGHGGKLGCGDIHSSGFVMGQRFHTFPAGLFGGHGSLPFLGFLG
ncbi:hypothetical protein [Desulfovibrio sp. ZJ369]|uniref:hypothetical protein n=1 Tax=Desulfovibrio sp. ZJ369 TaxID=2709793 RepID=UPI0013EA9BE9|nr:hypothetical protein [Desulfovibrio sp. ZJ369]